MSEPTPLTATTLESHPHRNSGRAGLALGLVGGLLLFVGGGVLGYQLRLHEELANGYTGLRPMPIRMPTNAYLPMPEPAAPKLMPVATRPGVATADASDKASKAWNAAEALFAAKQWEAAQTAYKQFDHQYAATRLHEVNANTLAERQAAVEDQLNPQPRPGLIGWYYTGREFGEGNLLIERIDPTVDFAWGGGSPAPEVPVDGFCVRWVGTLKVRQPGHYTLATVTDDGTRLKIDDKVVLEQWVDQADTRIAGEVDLTAGDHAIVMEMYENGGGATARLFWTLDKGFAEQIIPADALRHDPKMMKHPAPKPVLAAPPQQGDDANPNDDHF